MVAVGNIEGGHLGGEKAGYRLYVVLFGYHPEGVPDAVVGGEIVLGFTGADPFLQGVYALMIGVCKEHRSALGVLGLDVAYAVFLLCLPCDSCFLITSLS